MAIYLFTNSFVQSFSHSFIMEMDEMEKIENILIKMQKYFAYFLCCHNFIKYVNGID